MITLKVKTVYRLIHRRPHPPSMINHPQIPQLNVEVPLLQSVGNGNCHMHIALQMQNPLISMQNSLQNGMNSPNLPFLVVRNDEPRSHYFHVRMVRDGRTSHGRKQEKRAPNHIVQQSCISDGSTPLTGTRGSYRVC